MFPNDLWIADPHANKLYKVVDDVVQSGVLNTNNNPRSILVSQDMTSLYVVNRDANSITQYRSGSEIRDIFVGKMPYGICEDSNRNVYVTNYQDNTVSKITGSKVVDTIAVDAGPRGIVCDENDDIYVACFLSSTVCKISSGVNVASIEVGQNPEGITCDSSNNIWVACYGSNIISKISKGIKTLDVEVDKGPVAIVVDTNGTVYTANYYSNNVSMVATGSSSITVTNIPVGEGPTAIAINRDNAVYVTSGLGTDVRKIVDGAVIDTIEVCDNPSAFGDFTGCSAYNVFNAVPSGGESVGVPSGGWKITDLESGIQDAINKVIGGVSPSTADNVTYEKSTMIDDEEEILNITVAAALDELYTTSGHSNDPDKIIVDDTGKTLTIKLSELDTAVENAATDAELESVKTLATNAATQTQLNAVATIANNAATKTDLAAVSKVANAAATQANFNGLVSRVENIESSYNQPANITVEPGVTLDQKLESMQTDIDTRATTVALNNVKTTADAAAPQTALDAVDERLQVVEADYNKPDKIVVGKLSTPGDTPQDPPVVTDVTLTTKLTELADTDEDQETRLAEVESKYNKPDEIVVETREEPNEDPNPGTPTVQVDVTLTDKLGEIDEALATKADNTEIAEDITALTGRVDTIESKYNKPGEIIVEYTGDGQDQPVSLTQKLTDMVAATTQNTTSIEDHETRIAAVEADYNKPDKIIVGQVTGEDPDGEGEEEAPVTNVTLTQKLAEIDQKFTTQEEEDTSLGDRVTAIEADYNKPEKIIVGQVPSEEEPETSVDVTLATKLGEIDTEVEEVKALAEAAATQTDFDSLSQEVSTNEETLTQLKSDYDDTKSVVDGLESSVTAIQTDMNKPDKIIVGQTEEEVPADITLANKLTTMDAAIDAKAEQTALDAVKTTAEAAAPQTALDAVDTRLETVETDLNDPDKIIVASDPDTNLTTKLAALDESITLLQEEDTKLTKEISAAGASIADISAKYNKPENIVVDTGAGTTLTTKLQTIDSTLANKADTSVVDSKITAAVSGLQWKASVANVAALKAITTPEEGWTVSLADTNAIYRFDAQSEAEGDDDQYVKATDGTAGAWVKLGTTVYSVATGSADGLMSSADKAKLDGINISEYLKSTDAATTYLGIHAKADTAAEADNATTLNGHDDAYFATSTALSTTDSKVTALEGYFTEGKANTALALEGFDKSQYATTEAMNAAVADMNSPDHIMISEQTLTAKLGAMDSSISGKADTTAIADMLTKTEASSKYATTEAMTSALADKADTSALAGYVQTSAISDMLTKTEASSTYATSESVTSGLAAKADKTAIANMNDPAHIMIGDATLSDTINTMTQDIEELQGASGEGTVLAENVQVGDSGEPDHTPIMLDTKLSELDSTLASKADTSALSGYATTSAISDMLTKSEASGTYATKSEVSAKADSSAIANMNNPANIMISEQSLTDKLSAMDTSISGKADKTAIADMLTKTEATGTYATKESLADYATTEAMTGALANKADTSALAGYVQTSAISDMLTKSEASGKYATTTALTEGLAAKADSSALANYATTESLAGYATTSDIANMNNPANIMISEQSLTDKLSAMDTSISGKADTSALSGYATTTAIADMLTKSEASGTYATKSEVSAKVDSSAIANMNSPDHIMISEQTLTAKLGAMDSSISAKADTSALSGYVQTSAISDMLTKSEASSTYATTESLAGYATTSAIANMNNPDNIMISEQTLTATIATLQSTIQSLTERIQVLEGKGQ